MNQEELKLELERLSIKEYNYSLGTVIPNRYILLHSGSKWQTFGYDEHEEISEKREFQTEDEACKDMLFRLINLIEWRKKYKIK